jgi:CRP-like cAMP-binding protein
MIMVVSHSADVLTFHQVLSLGVALLCIFGIMAVLFSPKVGLLTMLPNLLPILVNFGLMGWAGIHLSVATSLIASIAIGLSVDDTIHYMVRFNREFKKDFIRRKAVARSSTTVGRPMVFTTLTLCLGFSVLLFSHFIPTIVFGFLILATLFIALWSDLLLLPIILLKIELVTLWDILIVEMGRDFYRRIPLFCNLNRLQIKALVAASFQEHILPGEVICRQGELGDTLYLILKGKVEVRFSSGEREAKVAELSDGEIFGEMGFFRGSPRAATVCTVEPTHVIHINERSLRRMVRVIPGTTGKLYLNLIQILANRLEQSNVYLSSLLGMIENPRDKRFARQIEVIWPKIHYHTIQLYGDKRFARQVEVIWRHGNATIKGETRDISVGGAFIITNQFEPPESIIELEFQLDDGEPPVHCQAKVVWVNCGQIEPLPPGFAVNFMGISKHALKRLLVSYDEEI